MVALPGVFVTAWFAAYNLIQTLVKREIENVNHHRVVEVGAGAGVGTVAGFIGGLLGVGGGNFILPVVNWLGLDAKMAVGTTALVVVSPLYRHTL